MCGSVSFDSGGFNGASGLSMFSNMASTMAQQRASSARDAENIEIGKRRYDDEYRQRVKNAIYAIQEADMAQQQANEAATQSKMEITREMLRAREEAKAAASASGISGNAVNRLLTDISVSEQQKKAVVDSNRDNIVVTQQLQKHKARESTHMDPFYYTEPSGGGFLNSMLGVVPGLFSGFNFTASTSCSTPSKKSGCK